MVRTAEAVQIGVIGLGGMGHTHAANVFNLDHEVAAGVDVVEEARDEFADQFGVPTYETFEAMYEAEDLDGVVVTTPNKFHEPATVAALERGYNVLCEKPLAHSLEAAQRIAEAADRSEGFCMVGFHNRFTTPVSVFKEYQSEGRFGEIRHVQANYVRRRGIPGVGSWFTDRELAGGGALIDIGIHALDLALYTLGYPDVEEVLGITRSDFGGRTDYADPDGFSGNWDSTDETFDVDDSVTALIRCADGKTISLEAAWAAEQSPTTDFVVRGTEGGAEFSLHEDSLKILNSGTQGTDHYVDSEITGSLEPAGRPAEIERFVDGILEGAAPEINTVEEGLTIQRVIDAIYRSSEDGEAKQIVNEPMTHPTP